MTDTLTHHRTLPAPPPAVRAAGGVRHLLWHLGEMAIAMIAGMLLLDPLWRLAATPFGLTAVLDRPDVAALVMATDMTAGMTVWMRYRRHSRAACAEMAAAMYVPFLLLLVPHWAGVLSGSAVLMGGHVLMVPAMVLVALRHRHDSATPAPRRHPVVAAAARRWPTALALLMTVDGVLAPSVPSPWMMLVLPTGYLLIGAYRRRLRGPGVLARQLAGLVAWSALALVAVAAGGEVAAWLVAAGWIGHAAWDVVHHRRGEVVPRAYAEWCAVLDLAVGGTVVLAVLTA